MKQSKPVLILMAMLSLLYAACSSPGKSLPVVDKENEQKQISTMLDSFNKAAAKADYKAYFNFFTTDAIFTGTDASERWDKAAFMAWAKPIFDKGTAWDFSALDRHIYFDSTGNLAWFDEVLNTQMKLCRGSGVVVKQGNDWKIKQYILSLIVPNNQLDSVVKMKAKLDDSVINSFQKK